MAAPSACIYYIGNIYVLVYCTSNWSRCILKRVWPWVAISNWAQSCVCSSERAIAFMTLNLKFCKLTYVVAACTIPADVSWISHSDAVATSFHIIHPYSGLGPFQISSFFFELEQQQLTPCYGRSMLWRYAELVWWTANCVIQLACNAVSLRTCGPIVPCRAALQIKLAYIWLIIFVISFM